ncbi:MAG TPA: Ig-like domain-containing protein [Polyangia bacterium]
MPVCLVPGTPLILLGLLAPLACSLQRDELPREGECLPFGLAAVTPADGATDVPPDAEVVYTFTDFPEPDTASSQNFGIFSGGYYYTANETVDLIGRRIVFKPTSSLPRGLGFTIGLSTRVTSLRGCPIAKPPPAPDGTVADSYYFSFRTVEPNVDLPARPKPPAPGTFAQVLDVMAARCSGCHLPEPDPAQPASCSPAPAGGVSLCASEAYASIVGVTSRQVSRLAIVAPRDSARSYLLRKLLGAPPTTGHRGPPGREISDEELTVIQTWIEAGARPN